MKKAIVFAAAAATTPCARAFVRAPADTSRTTHASSLNMGLFDGVKEAFGADGMGDLSSERETPIDRWMGWNAKSVDSSKEAVGSKGTFDAACPVLRRVFPPLVTAVATCVLTSVFAAVAGRRPFAAPLGFVDSMDASNYVTARLSKPMGIVFEENDSDFGGIFVLEVNEGSSAAADGSVRPGDQLVSVGDRKVSGMRFEDALGTIIDCKDARVKLTFFRGPAKFLYGPAGASQDWLNEFIAGGAKVESA
jgi:hypothetical protein